MEETQRILGDKIEYAKDKYDAILDVDALFVVTEWPEFKVLNFKVINKLLKEQVIFDGRNIYDVEEVKINGFKYFGIGVGDKL